jgi:hypothetical protein
MESNPRIIVSEQQAGIILVSIVIAQRMDPSAVDVAVDVDVAVPFLLVLDDDDDERMNASF